MKIFFVILLVFGAVNFSFASKYNTFMEFYNDINQLDLDTKKILEVRDIFFVKDGASFVLDSGVIYFCKPTNNKVISAFFEGRGSFNYMPKLKTEQNAVKLEYGNEFVDKQFDYVFLMFSDSTFFDLSQSGRMLEGSIPDKISKKFFNAKEYILNDNYHFIDEDVVDHLIEDNINGFFFSLIGEGRTMPVIFTIKPRLFEPVIFAKGDWYAASIGRYYRPLTCEQAIGAPIPTDENFDSLYNPFYRIKRRDFSLDYISNAFIGFNCNDTITISNYSHERQWFIFKFSKELLIEDISFEGKSQYYYKNEFSDFFAIKLNRKILKNEDFKIIVKYKNEKSERLWFGRFLVTAPPASLLDYRAKIGFTSGYYFTTDAKILKDDSSNYRYVTIENTNKPISFQIGEGKYKDTVLNENLKSRIYYYNNETPAKVYDLFHTIGGFYTSLFGPLDTNHLSFIPFFGSTIRGMIPIYEYKSMAINPSWHFGFSTNLASQWWLSSFQNLTYRDNWLLESLAQYSFFLYVTMLVKDKNFENEIYGKLRDDMLHFLNDKPKDLGIHTTIYRDLSKYIGLNKADVLTGSGPTDAAGFFLGSEYIKLKGAFILHSLRNMLIDLKTNSEEVFFGILKDFLKTFRNRRVTTEDFKATIEKQTKIDMQWFFDQWIYSNQIPKYTFGYKVEETPEGKFKIKCRVKQEKVDEGFIMPVLIKVDFGGDKYYPARVVLNQSINEFELPLMPMKPQNVKFNYNYSVLCEESTDDYEDIK